MTEGRHWQYPAARILVFARAPVAGQVKTRLAAAIGDQAAADIYAQWLTQGIEALSLATIAPIELWVTPDTSHPLFARLAESHAVRVHRQPDGDLGVGSPRSFDDQQRCYANVVKHHAEYRMWYTGNGFGTTGIGYAATPLSRP